ncbi:MAG: hypothetical protein Q7S39_04910 [Ignavibacteria bacterium]|nr:hypothetical protein [Ignavibacteria bacterium]
MLLVDPSFGGFGDITVLLRIGKFLISKGYMVYYTIVFDPKPLIVRSNIIPILENEKDILPIMYYPAGKVNLSPNLDFNILKTHHLEIVNEVFRHKFWEKVYSTFVDSTSSGVYGVSLEVFKEFQEGMLHPENVEGVKLRVAKIETMIKKFLSPASIDYEIALFGAHSFVSGNPIILIGQHSDEHISPELLKKGSGRKSFDFIIAPVPPQKSAGVLQAGFHTHTNYTVLPRKDVLNLLLKNKSLAGLGNHLQKSSWGAYYSGTLGTNGLFFKRLLSALPPMLRKHGQITYFTFLDESHFQKYVLRYLRGKPVGIIDLVSEQIIQDPSKKEVIFINLRVSNDFMEAIVNLCSLCSVCAGDSSFNMLVNNLNHNSSFTFFKYFNYDQKYFFQYLINTVHEFETKYNLGHEISRCLFSFGYYERIFSHHLKKEFTGLPFMGKNGRTRFIDEFSLFESERNEGWNVLGKLSRTRQDFRLIERLFYDEALIKQFNTIMRGLPAFIKERDGLLSVEDVLLSILEGKIKRR